MYRSFAACLLFCTAASVAPAASWADSMFEQLHWDFGSVPRGPAVSHPFRLTNRTKQAVHVGSIRVSCGCTSAQVLQNDLTPGQSTVMLVQMDTTRFVGAKSVTIYVTFDQPQWEEVRLWVQANARDDVSLKPDSMAFGQIKRGSGPGAMVELSLLGGGDWQVTEVHSDSNYVLTELVEKQRDPSVVTYELKARMRPDAPVGKWYTDIWLTTNHPASPRLRIPVTVEIESALSVSPPVAVLGEVKLGTEAERHVIVRGVKPFQITAIGGTDQSLNVHDSGNGSKPVHVLTVKLKGTEVGELSRNLHIVTDLVEDSQIDFQATAKVVP
jgi:hypothetical protein